MWPKMGTPAVVQEGEFYKGTALMNMLGKCANEVKFQ